MGRTAAWVLLVLSACRGAAPGELPSDEEPSSADSAPVDAAKGMEPASDAGGAPERVGGSNATRTPMPTDDAASGGAAEVAEGCGAERVTLDQLHSGQARGSVSVALGPLVASSQKFLVSEAKSGSCLWGAFAAEPGRTGAGSGLFLVSYGAVHAEGVACAAGSDGLPDDLQVGDSLDVEGRLDAYVPSTCDGTAPAQQLRIDAACPARRGNRGAPPSAARLEPALADRLAAGKDAQLLREWGGALVELANVSARQDPDDGDAVFPFGVVRLEQTALEVHSRLYYFDLSEGGPKAVGKAPRYPFPSRFESLTGVVFLDYCTWVLAPRAP